MTKQNQQRKWANEQSATNHIENVNRNLFMDLSNVFVYMHFDQLKYWTVSILLAQKASTTLFPRNSIQISFDYKCCRSLPLYNVKQTRKVVEKDYYYINNDNNYEYPIFQFTTASQTHYTHTASHRVLFTCLILLWCISLARVIRIHYKYIFSINKSKFCWCFEASKVPRLKNS